MMQAANGVHPADLLNGTAYIKILVAYINIFINQRSKSLIHEISCNARIS